MARIRCCCSCGLVTLLVLVMGADPGPLPAPPASVPADAVQSLEAAMRLTAEAQQAYKGISDYTCLFVKREQLRGQLQSQNTVEMKVRTKPFSVYMHWTQPKALAEQEACFVTGKNNGKMRARSPGILGVVGFISVDPNDARCFENSRHPITDAGIGNLIERFTERWDVEKRLNKTWVRITEYDYNQRRCTRVETFHPDNSGKHYSFYRSVLYFDKQSHLPIRVENYDWPRPGGDKDGPLLESYSYAHLRLNVGVAAATFDH
jgi:hypothetical protein